MLAFRPSKIPTFVRNPAVILLMNLSEVGARATWTVVQGIGRDKPLLGTDVLYSRTGDYRSTRLVKAGLGAWGALSWEP